MALIEKRHPSFGRLMNLWRSRRQGETPPPASALQPCVLADLADVTVVLVGSENVPELRIEASGGAVDALYGAPLTGANAASLSPGSDVAEFEARTAMETGQPLLIEEGLRCDCERRRVARLYLPLSEDDSMPGRVLCGVVAIA